jgi:hypothetical protein
MVAQERSDQHLEAQEIAAYVDGGLSKDTHAAVEAHLAICAECRAEVFDVSRIVRAAPRARSSRRPWARRAWIPMAAAAAAVFIIWTKPWVPRQDSAVVHRDEAQTVAAPRALSPVGQVDGVTTFVWSSVPQTDRYRVRLFDAQGTVVWESETPDTLGKLPRSVILLSGRTYYWKVEARTGIDRQTASDLTEFVTRGGPRR